MSESVVIALIGAQAVVLAAVLPPLLSARKHAKRAAGDAAEARDQVSNNHGTNLRDELDERHEENKGSLHELLEWKRQHDLDAAERDERIKLLEDTIPNPAQPRRTK